MDKGACSRNPGIVFAPQVVEHENAVFMNGFQNFRNILSRDRARERLKIAVFPEFFESPSLTTEKTGGIGGVKIRKS